MVSNTKNRLFLFIFSALYVTDINISFDYNNPSRFSGNVLLILIEIIFCLYFLYYCFFITVIQNDYNKQKIFFNQFVRFIINIGYIRKIDDFVIKSIK
jgi:coproporphyrinogen III oxidase-like Fe-S oxidoreductase